MDFTKEIKNHVIPEMKPLMEEFVKATDLLAEKAVSFEIHYKHPEGDVRKLFNRYVDLVWITYLVKFSTLMQSLIQTVNKDDFVTYGLVGRSMIEHSSIFRYYHKTQIVPKLEDPKKKKMVTQDQVAELINVFDKHLRGGRFHWESFLTNDFEKLYNGHRSNLNQFRIGDCIRDWKKDDPSIGILYDLFCDLVHPNLGSTLLIARIWPDGTGVGGKRGYPFGRDIFAKTFVGLLQVTQETMDLLDMLLFLRFPEDPN